MPAARLAEPTIAAKAVPAAVSTPPDVPAVPTVMPLPVLAVPAEPVGAVPACCAGGQPSVPAVPAVPARPAVPVGQTNPHFSRAYVHRWMVLYRQHCGEKRRLVQKKALPALQ